MSSRLTVLLSEALEMAAEQEREKESKDYSVDHNFTLSLQLGLERGKLMKLEEILTPAIEETKAVRMAIDAQVKMVGLCTISLSVVQEALLEAARILGVE